MALSRGPNGILIDQDSLDFTKLLKLCLQNWRWKTRPSPEAVPSSEGREANQQRRLVGPVDDD